MNNGWSEERDSLDTLYVPFVWVPDGAPEPTEWLAEHPDAFWVPATLVRGELSDHGLEAEPDSSDNSNAGYANEDPADGDGWLGTQEPASPAGDAGATGSAGLSGSRYGREDPVAAYLRINAVFSRLEAGRSTTITNSSKASLATGGSSPVPSLPTGAGAYVSNHPLNRTDPFGVRDNSQGSGGHSSYQLTQLVVPGVGVLPPAGATNGSVDDAARAASNYITDRAQCYCECDRNHSQ